ncbi:LamG domain-containing protein [Nibricoccus sp. IMCC34717]|uniref:LamG domain-containing protein n=1 Tax=Nibricoccus sp. IMCC34717 TaxID=3034021 RepID=UPI00384EE279
MKAGFVWSCWFASFLTPASVVLAESPAQPSDALRPTSASSAALAEADVSLLTQATWHGGAESQDGRVILDGFSGFGEGSLEDLTVSGDFSIEAWFMPGAYPWHQAPLVRARDSAGGGFNLGLDAHGRITWALDAAGSTVRLAARQPLTLRRWHHVVATGNQTTAELFVDGQPAGSATLQQPTRTTQPAHLLIGRSPEPALPDGAIRPEANARVHAFLDGALGSLLLHRRAMTPAEVAARWQDGSAQDRGTPLAARVLPAGPEKAAAFGAFPTRLAFYPEWDRAWRTAGKPDVVVAFGERPGRLVFWRGTSFIPHWVTENGIWFTNEFNETWGDVKGCGEPMSDKQCRYSRVAVLESGPARAVVQWRYALTDVFYTIARPDADTGWGDWSDELYTVYPDGTAVRCVTLHSSQPDAPHEWHEAIVVMNQGMTPSDALEPAGLSVLHEDGQRHDLSWAHGTPPHDPGAAQGACIQLVNTKSRLRPFTICRPQDRPRFTLFAKEIRPEASLYPWWNHWPASPNASDGRYAFAADRPSHSSLSNIAWEPLHQTGLSTTKIQLCGLTDKPIEALLPFMRAWSHPATSEARSGATPLASRFLPEEKAYHVSLPRDPAIQTVTLRFAASDKQPLVNPCIVLEDWGDKPVILEVDGRSLRAGTDYRQQSRVGLEQVDAILWLPLETRTPLTVSISGR